eukprot:COSAG05_NODE_1775_length_4109_cov_2.715960_5_plen_174_part_00
MQEAPVLKRRRVGGDARGADTGRRGKDGKAVVAAGGPMERAVVSVDVSGTATTGDAAGIGRKKADTIDASNAIIVAAAAAKEGIGTVVVVTACRETRTADGTVLIATSPKNLTLIAAQTPAVADGRKTAEEEPEHTATDATAAEAGMKATTATTGASAIVVRVRLHIIRSARI